MAENHPVGFQWVMEAREHGAKVIHVDPRFTRTSAVANLHVPIRPGSDIAFLGGIIRYILENDRAFKEYVVNYTNAPMILREDFKDTEDLDGFFSGWHENGYSFDSWQYDSAQDKTLQNPRCVYQLLKRHYARYTPETVAKICGVTPAQLTEVAEALCANSGRERTSAFCYSVGWTQHTTGAQTIRGAAIIQLLLGNIGRPGGGIMALRGHASIQGSTDIPTLFNLLPGYISMPRAGEHPDLKRFIAIEGAKKGYWGNIDTYLISLLKAWFGEHAAAENDFCFDLLPRINGDHSTFRSIMDMLDGRVKGFFCIGENPAVGSGNSGLHRRALANLEWLVVRDFSEIESASFWYDAREIASDELQTETIKTEVFWMPAAAHTEKSGSFTNTQRLLQWHDKAVEPQGEARSDLWFYYHLGKRIKQKIEVQAEPHADPIRFVTWEYPERGDTRDPDAAAVLREINGWDAHGKALSGYGELRADGSTSCGCWIYSGCYENEQNQTARRKPGSEQHWVAPEWAWAWPANRRILYNRASADPHGDPWSECKKYVWWDEEKSEWTGLDTPDFERTKPPDYVPPDGAKAQDAIAGDHPFIMQGDGLGWIFAPSGLVDGPLPAHYEPHESPVQNTLYSQQGNPCRQELAHTFNESNPSPSERHGGAFPFVLYTYRLTEHHTAGGMSRSVAHLSELQPEFFCEVSPALAQLRGLEHGDWATIFTARAVIEARVMVTDRVKPMRIQGKELHSVGLPYHWGTRGLVTGDSANDLLQLTLEPNAHINETKGLTCDIIPGRRPRGKAVPGFLNAVRERT